MGLSKDVAASLIERNHTQQDVDYMLGKINLEILPA